MHPSVFAAIDNYTFSGSRLLNERSLLVHEVQLVIDVSHSELKSNEIMFYTVIAGDPKLAMTKISTGAVYEMPSVRVISRVLLLLVDQWLTKELAPPLLMPNV